MSETLNKDKYFMPYQARWINDSSRYKLAEKSARTGYTLATAYEAVEDCAKHKTTWWYQGNDLGTALEFAGYCAMFARLLNAAYTLVDEEVIDERQGIKASILRFENKSRIIALSSNPLALHGKGGNIILDEFAHHPNQKDLWTAAYRATFWGDKMRVLSTHSHENTEFNRLCKEARAVKEGKLNPGKDVLPWSFHYMPIDLALKQGLFARLKHLGATTAENIREFIEMLRAGCRTEQEYNRMYACIPESEAEAWLSYDEIDACISYDLTKRPAWVDILIKRADDIYLEYRHNREDPDPRCGRLRQITDRISFDSDFYIGFDIGRKVDLSVIWIASQVEKTLKTQTIIELHKTPFFKQEKILFPLMYHRQFSRANIDSTGIGAQMGERAIDVFGGYRVEAIEFNVNNKQAMADLVRRAFEDRSVRIPAHPVTRESLHSVKKFATATGNFRFDAERTDATGHADEFWALALCLSAAEQPSVQPEYVSSGVKCASAQLSGVY